MLEMPSHEWDLSSLSSITINHSFSHSGARDWTQSNLSTQSAKIESLSPCRARELAELFILPRFETGRFTTSSKWVRNANFNGGTSLKSVGQLKNSALVLYRTHVWDRFILARGFDWHLFGRYFLSWPWENHQMMIAWIGNIRIEKLEGRFCKAFSWRQSPDQFTVRWKLLTSVRRLWVWPSSFCKSTSLMSFVRQRHYEDSLSPWLVLRCACFIGRKPTSIFLSMFLVIILFRYVEKYLF